MIEILFRGKRKDNGEWVEGYYVCLGKEYHYIFTGKLDFANGCFEFEKYEVIPETVGRHTRLDDKNGKKIFEGDIVDCWSEGINAQGTVQQRKDGMWIIYPAWQNLIMWGLCPDEYSKTTVEVIGNAVDNPELLSEVHE